MKKYNFVIHNNNLANTVQILKKILENDCDDAKYIIITTSLDKLNKKKIQTYCDKLRNNKEYKPIKIFFDGQDFFVTRQTEKYLASIITQKNLAKLVVKTTKKLKNFVSQKNIADFVSQLN